MLKPETIEVAAKQVEALLALRAQEHVLLHPSITPAGVNALVECLAEVRGKATFLTDRKLQLQELCESTTMSMQNMRRQIEVLEQAVNLLSREVVK